MSKLILEYDYHNSMWDEDPKYNELFIASRINYFQDAIKSDGVIVMKEVLKSFGYNTSHFSTEVLTRYWADGDIDISYVKTGDNEWDIIFKTDN